MKSSCFRYMPIFALSIIAMFPKITYSGLFDGDIKVKMQYCKDFNNPKLGFDDNLFAIFTYVVNKEKQEIIRKNEFYANKKLNGNNLTKLDDCTVIDKANWQCGGARIGNYLTSIESVVNGVYNHTENNPGKTSGCIKFTQY